MEFGTEDQVLYLVVVNKCYLRLFKAVDFVVVVVVFVVVFVKVVVVAPFVVTGHIIFSCGQ